MITLTDAAVLSDAAAHAGPEAVVTGPEAVVTGLDARLAPGTVTALVGGDGAGKSTVLEALAGRHRIVPTPAGLAAVPAERIGFQPASGGVWADLSIEENIAFVARVYGLDAARTRQRAELLLRAAGLQQARNRIARRLSGGMRQKLGFVMATLHAPDLVLLDEPTTGVDPVSRSELWSLIAAAAAGGAAVVVATTYLDEAERATSLLLLSAGRVLASGSVAEVVAAAPVPEAEGSAYGAEVVAGAPVTDLERPGEPAGAPARTQPDRSRPGDLESATIAYQLAAEADRPADLHLTAANRWPPEARPDQELIAASAVSRHFGSFTALQDVSLTVRSGEILGLLGGNGAGKTTLMRIMLGLEQPTSGSVALFGAPPARQNRRRLGYVSQGLGLYPALSAAQNLDFAASVNGAVPSRSAERFARACGPRPVGRLPLGTQRVLACLAAVQHGPELLILDEPTSGMDALARARLWQQLRTLADAGVGVLVTTHYMQEAAQCDRLVILTAGQVSATGTPGQITSGQQSVLVEAADWAAAFERLRAAGLPVSLDGTRLRVPGGDVEEIRRVLADPSAKLSIRSSTLEETMLIAQRAGTTSG